MLGGLIRTRRATTKQGIPWLSKIPVIGFLFGATVDRIERTELLLLITPRVIGDPSEGQEIYQQVRGQRPGLEQGPAPAPEHPPARGDRRRGRREGERAMVRALVRSPPQWLVRAASGRVMALLAIAAAPHGLRGTAPARAAARSSS